MRQPARRRQKSKNCGKVDQIPGLDLKQHGFKVTASGPGPPPSPSQPQQSPLQGMDHNQADYMAAGRAQGHPHADFRGALRYQAGDYAELPDGGEQHADAREQAQYKALKSWTLNELAQVLSHRRNGHRQGWIEPGDFRPDHGREAGGIGLRPQNQVRAAAACSRAPAPEEVVFGLIRSSEVSILYIARDSHNRAPRP